MNQTQSSKTVWYVVGAIVVIALLFWIFRGTSSSTVSTENPSDNSASAISAEFNQTSDGSSALDQDAAASAQAVQGF